MYDIVCYASISMLNRESLKNENTITPIANLSADGFIVFGTLLHARNPENLIFIKRASFEVLQLSIVFKIPLWKCVTCLPCFPFYEQ